MWKNFLYYHIIVSTWCSCICRLPRSFIFSVKIFERHRRNNIASGSCSHECLYNEELPAEKDVDSRACSKPAITKWPWQICLLSTCVYPSKNYKVLSSWHNSLFKSCWLNSLFKSEQHWIGLATCLWWDFVSPLKLE